MLAIRACNPELWRPRGQMAAHARRDITRRRNEEVYCSELVDRSADVRGDRFGTMLDDGEKQVKGDVLEYETRSARSE